MHTIEREGWVYPTPQELAGQRIKIETDGLVSVWGVLIKDEQGRPIGNVQRLRLVLDIDVNGGQTVEASIGLWQDTGEPWMKDGKRIDAEIAAPDLRLDAIATPEREEKKDDV
jgi:hypothetical protein